MKDKKNYSSPELQVKVVAVENGFQLSVSELEIIREGVEINF